MGRLSSVLRNVEDGGLMYHCEGCKCAHVVWTGEGTGPRWGYNGNADKPTFTPSVLVRWPSMSEEGRARGKAFEAANGRLPSLTEIPFDKENVCHTFITDGVVDFLPDCTHHLAGQKRPMVTDDLDDTEATGDSI